MHVEDLLAQLSSAGRRLGVAVSAVRPEQVVPSCPDWTVTDLLSHVYRVHARVAHSVRGRGEALTLAPLEQPELLGAYQAGLEDLVKALRSARENLDIPTLFRADSAKLFWIRRMTHETTIHQIDAELAADSGMLEVPTAIAEDGLAEFLQAIVPGAFSLADIRAAATITLMPLDVNRAWTVTLSSAGVRTKDVATDRADLTVAGMATDLYRWVWNRATDDTVSLGGDVKLADLWHRNLALGKQ